MHHIIHRGTREIGGTVIELRTNRTRLLVDIGHPLTRNSAPVDVAPLKPDAALISHPHQDHYAGDTSEGWRAIRVGVTKANDSHSVGHNSSAAKSDVKSAKGTTSIPSFVFSAGPCG